MTVPYSKTNHFGGKLNESQLHDEIQANKSITIKLDHIDVEGDNVNIVFFSTISTQEETILDGIVASHEPRDINEKNIVLIDEMHVPPGHQPVGGNFRAETKFLNIIPSGITSEDYVWPYPISVLDFSFVTSTENKGDNIEIIVAPDTVIGALGADANINDTELSVTSTVVENLMIGYRVEITDGINTEDLGWCTNINKNDYKITVQNPLTNAYSFTSPTYIKMSIYVVCDYKIGNPWFYNIGAAKIGGSYIPAGRIVRVKYINNSATTKEITTELEYLY